MRSLFSTLSLLLDHIFRFCENEKSFISIFDSHLWNITPRQTGIVRYLYLEVILYNRKSNISIQKLDLTLANRKYLTKSKSGEHQPTSVLI